MCECVCDIIQHEDTERALKRCRVDNACHQNKNERNNKKLKTKKKSDISWEIVSVSAMRMICGTGESLEWSAKSKGTMDDDKGEDEVNEVAYLEWGKRDGEGRGSETDWIQIFLNFIPHLFSQKLQHQLPPN